MIGNEYLNSYDKNIKNINPLSTRTYIFIAGTTQFSSDTQMNIENLEAPKVIQFINSKLVDLRTRRIRAVHRRSKLGENRAT